MLARSVAAHSRDAPAHFAENVRSVRRRSFLVSGTLSAATDADVDGRYSALLERMTVAEKIGQMSRLNGAEGKIPDRPRNAIFTPMIDISRDPRWWRISRVSPAL